MPSKDSDIVVEKEETEEDQEEDYEIGEGDSYTTLRKSSAFTLERLSSNIRL
jgi:hypothetical protein